MEFSRKRWISLLAAMTCSLFVGIAYSWSVYVNPLSDKFGWTTGEVAMGYTINVLAMALTPIICGPWRARLTISRYTLIGTFIYGGGIILCSFMRSSVWELYLYFGLLVGAGIGIVYLSLASYVVQLFPDRKGMAAGLFTACYGCGAIFWAPAASYIIIATGNVDMAFRYLGIFFCLVLVIATRFLYEIPQGYQGEAGSGAGPGLSAASVDVAPRRLFTTPLYYIIIGIYSCGLLSGMTFLALGSPILQSTLEFTPEKAAIIVGLFAVAQTLGRLFWGWISDRLGRMNVLVLLGLCSCACLGIIATVSEQILFISALLALFMCYGAYASLLSPIAVETFGTRYFAMNYNLLFLSFGMAALIGPQETAFVRASSGGYEGAYIYAICFAGIALLCSLLFRVMRKRRDTANLKMKLELIS